MSFSCFPLHLLLKLLEINQINQSVIGRHTEESDTNFKYFSCYCISLLLHYIKET